MNPDGDAWRERLRELERSDQVDFYSTFSSRWHDSLDGCAGECLLAKPMLSKIVTDSLLYSDGDRYEMTDFVVMPYHCHWLAAFQDGDQMLKQCESWKRFTARKINKAMRRAGDFWQQDGLDHLVRSVEQFEHFRRYISNNPKKANRGLVSPVTTRDWGRFKNSYRSPSDAARFGGDELSVLGSYVLPVQW